MDSDRERLVPPLRVRFDSKFLEVRWKSELVSLTPLEGQPLSGGGCEGRGVVG